MKTPGIFKIGLIALGASIIINLFSLFAASRSYVQGERSFPLLALLIFAFNVFLAYQISKTKNWARKSFLVLLLGYTIPVSLVILLRHNIGPGSIGLLWHGRDYFLFVIPFYFTLLAPVLLQIFSACAFFSESSSLYFLQEKQKIYEKEGIIVTSRPAASPIFSVSSIFMPFSGVLLAYFMDHMGAFRTGGSGGWGLGEIFIFFAIIAAGPFLGAVSVLIAVARKERLAPLQIIGWIINFTVFAILFKPFLFK